MRNLSKELYKHDYLDAQEIEAILTGRKLKKEKIREYNPKTSFAI